ncbi:MAG TPA: hypothetical protein DCZ43_02665, partial [candidate division Zixibacteria bacterium]|nr:hypothetical protein [candidate division Zixibacteria bacterium]
MEIIPGTYSVTASAVHFNSSTSSGIVVSAGDTTVLDFALNSPALLADTSAIDTSFVQGHLITVTRRLENTGSGPLDFSVRMNTQGPLLPKSGRGDNNDDLPGLTDFGDEVFIFDPQTQTNDDGCVGVEFDGRNFWV